METKRLQWTLWLVLFIASIVYFTIVGLGNLGVFAVTSAYGIFGITALIILKDTKSDEPYYVNINFFGLGAAVGVAAVMVGIGLVFGFLIGPVTSNQSLVPTSFVSSASTHGPLAVALGIVQVPSSYATCLLSDILFNFLIIALVEEMLKFACISGLRDALGPLAEREKRKHRIVLYTLLIGFCFIEPILLWTIWHSLEAYSSAWLLVPAFINGLLLFFLMFTRKVGKVKLGVIAAIIAHGSYDSYITLSAYLQGTVSTANGLPLFPSSWSFADIYIMFLLVPLSIICLAIPIFLSRDE